MQVIDCWGFTYKTIGFVWTKINHKRILQPRHRLLEALYSKGVIGFLDWLRFFGPGYYTKSNSEPCLLATRGDTMKPATNKVSNVIFAPRGTHSAKPEEVCRRIEQMYPPDQYDHLELFARQGRPGWVSLGNEIDGLDITEALKRIS